MTAAVLLTGAAQWRCQPPRFLTLYITISFSDTAFNYLFYKPAAAVLIDSSCGAVEGATTLNSCMSSYITTWFSDLALNDWFSKPMDNAAWLWEVAVGTAGRRLRRRGLAPHGGAQGQGGRPALQRGDGR